MPFLTEELWHQLPQRSGARSIALDRFPEPRVAQMDSIAEENIPLLQEIITAVRNVRAEMKLDTKAKVPAQLATGSDSIKSNVEGSLDTILRLANLFSFEFLGAPLSSPKRVNFLAQDFL